MGATTQLKYGDNSLTLPTKDGTIGPSVIDIGKLYAQTGMPILTASCGRTSTIAGPPAILRLVRSVPAPTIVVV